MVRSRLRNSVHLLDLRGRGAMLAGIASGISGTENRSLTQAWGRHFYEHPAVYGHVHGLVYANSHNGMDAVVLFERAANAIERSVQKVTRLANPRLEAGLLDIADRNGLIVL